MRTTVPIDPAIRLVGSITWAEAIDRLDHGETTIEVANAAGVSRQRIAQVYAAERGEAQLSADRKTAYRADLFPRIVKAFEDRPRSAADIADDLGTTLAMVSEALEGAGYGWPERSGLLPPHKNGKPIDIERATALYESGLGYEQIANQFGVATMTVYRQMKEAGHESREVGSYSRMRAGLSPVEVNTAKVAKMYEAGMSAPAIAKRYGVATITIYRHLTAAGVTMRKSGMPAEIDIDRAVRLYNDGETLRGLAETFGVSTTTIRKRLVEAGVKTRSMVRLQVEIN